MMAALRPRARRASIRSLDTNSQTPDGKAPAPASSGTISTSFRLIDIWRAAAKRWRMIAAATAVVTALGFLWTYRQPKIYEGTCTVVIESTAPQVLENVKDVVTLGGGSYWSTKEFYATQFRIIKSQAVARRVVAVLGLAADPEFGGAANETDLANAVLDRIRVDPLRDSHIASIIAEDMKPERAAQLANAFADAYIESNLDYKLDGTKNASLWLAEQEVDLRAKLEKSELGLYQYKKDKNLLAVSLDDKQSMTSQNLQHINQKLADVRAKRIELDSARKIIVAAKANPQERESLPEIRQNPVIQKLQGSLVELGETQATLESHYGDEHPKLIALKRQTAALRRDYEKSMDEILRSFDMQYEALVQTERSLMGWMEREKKDAIELSKVELEYKPLARDADNAAKVYGMVNQRQKEANLSGLMKVNNVRVLERATAMRFPSKPRVLINIALAVLLGLLGSGGVAVALEVADTTVKGQSDVERSLALPVLGVIPVVVPGAEGRQTAPEALRSRDLLVFHDPKCSAAEAYRSLRTNLLFLSPDKPIHTLVVTSAGPQEGKTTSAVGLAVTLAQAGQRTILIDTDMRRPRLHTVFGMPNDSGISNAIIGDAAVPKVVQHSEVANLDVLTCGPTPPNPAELLHTERFRRVLAECVSSYDWVILDSPPTSAVTDPAVLGNIVDGVLLVVKAGATNRHAALQARRQLEAAKARMLGVVLNEVDLSNRAYGYYYYRRSYARYGVYGSRDKAA